MTSWDKLSLDHLDRIHLLSLPLKARTLVWGKFAGMLAFAVAVATVANLFPTLIAAAFPAEVLQGLFIGGWAHFAANLLCGVFAFLFVALARILVVIIFPSGRGRYAAVLAQILLLLTALSPLVWFFMIHPSLATLKVQSSSLFTFYPPLWFSGVYNRLIGVPDPFLDDAARLGLAAISILLVACMLASSFCMKKILDGVGPAPVRRRRPPRTGRKFLPASVFFHPIQAAVFQFFWQTVSRSREHKLRLTLLGQFVHLYLQNGFSDGTRDYFLISLPLLLHFFLIIGMRMTAAYPHTLPANFIFRISEVEPLRYYVSGLRMAFTASVVLPPLVVCFFLCLFFWGPWISFLHTLYCLAVAMLFLELCLFEFRIVPFAAEHVPGKYKLRYYWLALLIASYIYYKTFFSLGQRLQRDPAGYSVFFLLAILMYALLRLRRTREMNEARLVFQEEPEPAILTLGLD